MAQYHEVIEVIHLYCAYKGCGKMLLVCIMVKHKGNVYVAGLARSTL